MAGYSGRSLADKLGIKSGMKLLLINPIATLIEVLPTDVTSKQIVKPTSSIRAKYDYIHFFALSEAAIASSLSLLRKQIEENGMIWISWPKKAAKKLADIDTDLSEDIIRHHALRNDLVDVKVCAVDEIWSGLKLVIPLESRKR